MSMMSSVESNPNAPSTGAASEAPASSPPVSGAPSSKSLLKVSDEAALYAQKRLVARGTPEAAVRLGIRGGGCSGFSYVIEFSDEPPRARDTVIENQGVRFYVDKKSLIYLAGSSLEYENTLMFQGFKFVNPREATRCGCGHSFTVR